MSFLAALGFLTGIPVGRGAMQPERLRRSSMFFPLVGLIIGALIAGIDYGLGLVLPGMLTSAITVAVLLLLTGALHFEGFVDCCDGLFGGHTRERRLEIMRDKSVGAYAVAGGALLLIVKFAAISSLAVGWERFCIIALFPAMSRWGMALALNLFPYARAEGLGSAFKNKSSTLYMLIAGVIAFIIAITFGWLGGVILLAIATTVALLAGWGISRMLGGLTGDTYGAINELTEVFVLIVAVAIVPHLAIQPIWQVCW
ncbi:MAG: adenosylcobinamide-GDP ribazoletransferase [Chloroflexota bacterium]|nr:adenosylcobinamide-GDP ribazoletransferase [Chloroflexota bacterium]